MEVRNAFKLTEVGAIPDDWEITTVGNVSQVKSGKRLPLGSHLQDYETKHPYLRVSDMRPGTVDLSNIRFVPDDVFPSIKNYRIFIDDIFISVAGTLGICGFIPKELNGANLTENANRLTSISCSRDYLLHVLMSPGIQDYIEEVRTVGAQPKLALGRIRQFALPLPALHEQRAIAKALSDVDALLSALDRLIAKKRDLKQAVMQQLLTGETRLPGFTGAWKQGKLGDVILSLKAGVSVRSAQGHPTIGEPSVLKTSALDSGFLRHKERKRIHSNDLERASTCLEKGSVLISRMNTPDLVGEVAYVPDDFPETFLPDRVWMAGFTQDLCAIWLTFLLCSSNFRNRLREIATGTSGSMKNISKEKLLDLAVVFPTYSEQVAIASCLSDFDQTITELSNRRLKIQRVKQGMMQELLTGRIRLVPPETSRCQHDLAQSA